MAAIITNTSETFGREVAIFMPGNEADATLKPSVQSPESSWDENELAVASWAFRHGQPAGRGMDTLPASAARYVPLKTAWGSWA